MLIIKMLQRISQKNQRELAEYLNVSRASINKWLNSDTEMTKYEKNKLSEKLDLPLYFFDKEIEMDYKKCKELYLLIQSKLINLEGHKLNVDELLDKIEFDIKKETRELTDYQIIDGLCNGYNPYTGEKFDAKHILNDEKINNFLLNVKKEYIKKMQGEVTIKELSESDKSLFQEFKRWRQDIAYKKEQCPIYTIFTDKELINIVTSNVVNIEDLKNIKGIGEQKYKKYGEDIYNILKQRKYYF